MKIKRLCVFCGANSGARVEFTTTAAEMGVVLAQRRITLVYGGGGVGLMGALADAVLAAGGDVIGVIPEALVAQEVAHKGLADLRVVKSMHERKALMADLADGFVALPGGFGTLDEFFEIVTWAQLGMHHKPCGLLNAAGFFDGLLSHLDRAVMEEFIQPAHRRMLLVESEPVVLLDRMEHYDPPVLRKWIERART